MVERWFGIVATRSKISLAGLEYDEEETLPKVFLDEVIPVASIDPGEDYRGVYERIRDLVTQFKVDVVVVKGSSGSPRPTKKGGKGGSGSDLLPSAEVRGVVIAAAASVAKVKISNPSALSRGFGDRSKAEYVSDAEFWKESVSGKLRATAKEPALQILSEKKKK